MQLALFFATATLTAVVSPVLNANADDNVGNCQLPTPVEEFVASAYTALIVTTDPKILTSLKLTGGEAAILLYKTLNDVLGGYYKLCNAERVAFSGSRGLATIGNETLSDFYKKAVIAYGQVLYNNKKLTCDNGVSLALSLYTNIKKALESRDPTKFYDQMYAVVIGVDELFLELGLDLEIVTQETATVYAQEYLSESGNYCKTKVAN